jgi:phosphoribosylanthranilate isomerase
VKFVVDRPIIQIAGVKSQKEAEMLMQHGVEYLGFPLRLDVNTPDTTEEEAAKIIRSIKEPHKSVLITYLDKAGEIEEFMRALGVTAIQIHGDIEINELEKLRKKNPNFFLIKSLVITGTNEGELQVCLEQTNAYIDAYITDTFDPKTGAKGATGKTHDWSISKRFVEISPKPVILAGGLNPTNVAEAIGVVCPAGVDVHTGVEDSNGDKSPQLVKQFVERALAAFNKL